jgi:DMSO/TMAO reductase YedYZ molybdopterin-dependent catalytic subunit
LVEVLDLADGEHFIVVASDGMTTQPVPVAAAGVAVLVHSLSGDLPLPEDLGGPFRLLAPKGGTCSNVKGVVRIEVL